MTDHQWNITIEFMHAVIYLLNRTSPAATQSGLPGNDWTWDLETRLDYMRPEPEPEPEPTPSPEPGG